MIRALRRGVAEASRASGGIFPAPAYHPHVGSRAKTRPQAKLADPLGSRAGSGHSRSPTCALRGQAALAHAAVLPGPFGPRARFVVALGACAWLRPLRCP